MFIQAKLLKSLRRKQIDHIVEIEYNCIVDILSSAFFTDLSGTLIILISIRVDSAKEKKKEKGIHP
jgi:hypothetical protein